MTDLFLELMYCSFATIALFFVAFLYRATKTDKDIARLNLILTKKEGELAAVHLKLSAIGERVSTVNQRLADVTKDCGELRFKLKKGRLI